MAGRNNNLTRLLELLALMAGALLSTTCHRVPLYDPGDGVFLALTLKQDFKDFLPCEINFDNNPAFKALAMGRTPTQVRVYVYDTDTHELVKEDLLPAQGGFVDIEPGVYDVIAYGMGTEVTRLSEARNRGLFKAYTDPVGTLSQDGVGGTIIDQPDQLYAGSATLEVPVRPAEGEFVRLQMDLSPMVETYAFTAFNISGLEHVSSVTCYLTGQAPDRYLWDEHFTVQPMVQQFGLTKDAEAYMVQGVFNTFGKIPEYTATAYLQVLVTTSGGQKYTWSYDVTDQMANPDNSCHTIVVDNPIEIPKDGTGSSGFGPTVQPWEGEVFDIPIR